MAVVKPARVDYTLTDGQEVHLSVNFWGIKMLRGKEKHPGVKDAREALNRLITEGGNEVDVYADALYGAYLIGLWEEDDTAEPMSMKDFELGLGDNFGTVSQAARYLLDPNARKVSGKRSTARPES